MKGIDLNSLPKSIDSFGLDRIKEILFSLKLNRASFPWIHIAGTKGKGSVSVFIANILRSSGYKVGLFLSPHLQAMEERISINLKPLSRETFEDLYKEATSLIPENQLTSLHYFEILTFLCFYYFTQQKVEVAVIETGLGGRLDATSAVENPLLTVITNLGFDHMERLGKSLQSITYEKAGIIKTGVPLMTASQPEISKQILKKEASLMRSTFYSLDDFATINRIKPGTPSLPEMFSVHSRVSGHLHQDLSTSLLGMHQTANAALSVLSAEVLKKDLPRVSNESIKEGIKNAFIPGRFEKVTDERYPDKTILLDGAHNPDSARALVETLQERYPDRKIVFLVSFLKNKLAREIIETLARVASFFQFTSLPNHDTYNGDDYKELLLQLSLQQEASYEKVAISAYQGVVDKMRTDELLCITGSLYLVGLMRDYFRYLPCSSYDQAGGGVMWTNG